MNTNSGSKPAHWLANSAIMFATDFSVPESPVCQLGADKEIPGRVTAGNFVVLYGIKSLLKALFESFFKGADLMMPSRMIL